MARITATAQTRPEPKPRAGEPPHAWRPLRLFNLYRIVLAGLFLIIALNANQLPFLDHHTPRVLLNVSLGYLAFGIASGFLIHWHRPDFTAQVYAQAIADVTALTLFTYAAGGLASGVGMLLIITVASTAYLLPGLPSYLIAALATLAILAGQALQYLQGASLTSYTHAGLLGATFFATALLVSLLGRRVRESEHLAAQRGVDLANMAQLNEHVIQYLQSGVLVVDPQLRVRLINQAAWTLLGMPVMGHKERLEHLSSPLGEQLRQWLADAAAPPHLFRVREQGADLLPTFTRLGTSPEAGILIFLDDMSQMAQQAQQMKLASLGRLTASIAHEVRNPLGAISHAAQLLGEAPALDPGDQRLVQIIQQHCARVNTIIENILQLSRRERVHPQALQLRKWLTQFVEEFCQGQRIGGEQVALDITPPDAVVTIDPTQFHQVLWNLCSNGLRHSLDYPGFPKLELRGGIALESRTPFLDIIDHGPGIAPETAQHIFEPFFTTEASGTGLGLYIARELCESNRARLEYIPVPTGGSCFRITFGNLEQDL